MSLPVTLEQATAQRNAATELKRPVHDCQAQLLLVILIIIVISRSPVTKESRRPGMLVQSNWTRIGSELGMRSAQCGVKQGLDGGNSAELVDSMHSQHDSGDIVLPGPDSFPIDQSVSKGYAHRAHRDMTTIPSGPIALHPVPGRPMPHSHGRSRATLVAATGPAMSKMPRQ